jgi:predicted RNA-binding protein YlxR (DUF448 family)
MIRGHPESWTPDPKALNSVDGVDLMTVFRTCIGCRSRADKTTLVRLVAVGGEARSQTWIITPDPRGTLPGRGAHLHPDPRCLEMARRRRAFGRALRVEGPLDLGLVDALVGTEAPETHTE